MKHTLGTAAKACGIGRTTIFRAIKSGKISAVKDENGNYAIDPAELHRVYPTIAEKQSAQQAKERDATGKGTSETEDKMNETAVLLAKIEGLQILLGREQETITDLRRRLDQSETERRETQGKLTALLTHQPEKKEEPKIETTTSKGSLFEKLFGRSQTKR